MAVQPMQAQIFALIRLTKRWLEPGKGVGHVVETLVVDKFLRELPMDLKKGRGANKPVVSRRQAYGSTWELLKGDKQN
jgi:hypothetical protein